MLLNKNVSFTDLKNIQDAVSLFPKSVAAVECYTKNAIVDVQEQIGHIKNIAPSERTFFNTVKAIDNLEAYSDFAVTSVLNEILSMVSPDKVLADAAQAAHVELKRFAVDHIFNNVSLYQALQEYVHYGMQHEQLTGDQRYYIEERLKEYRREGLDLLDEKQHVVKSLKKELADLTTQFELNIAQDTTKLLFKPSDLAGTSQDFFDSLATDDQGNKIVTMAYPTVDAILENCTVADTRKKMSIAFHQRAYPANQVVLEQMITKRNQLAQVLGFSHYADLELASQMVTSPAQIEQFLHELMERATPKALEELQQFTQELPDSVVLSESGKLFGYDYNYVSSVYKKKHFSVDETVLAAYFPMEKTITGLFAIYEKFFNIRFKEVPVSGVWDDSVKGLAVSDASGTVLGYFLLDLYPRENKFSHACHCTLVPSTYNADGAPNKAFSIVIANFSKPTATKPSLLRRYEVLTFFHEFGHALHALLGRTKMASFSGTSVKRDFVELPSQMLEEWLQDKDILQSLSSHYQTGEQLSDAQIASIFAVKNFDKGYWILRQIYLSLLSLNYFKGDLTGTPQALMQKIFTAIIPTVEFSPDSHMYASFGHLNDYNAKYYGYLWSRVLALDLFDSIKKEGLLNPVVGKRYVEQVIGRGGEVDPNILLENFLGRKPNQEAFLQDVGL